MSSLSWAAATSLLSVALPFRFLQLHLSVLQYGITLAAYGAGMLVTETLWGVVAFRLGQPRRIVAIGAVVVGITASFAVIRTFPEFLVAMTAFGATGIFLIPVLRWLFLTGLGPGTHAAGTGRLGFYFGLGLTVGASVGPLLFVSVGFWAVAALAVGLLGLAVAAGAVLPWAHARLPAPVRRPHWRGFLGPFFVVAAGLAVLEFTALTFTTNFLQLYSTVLFGGTPSEAGYVVGLARAVTLVTSFLFGPVVDRWTPLRSAPAGFLLLVAGGLGTWASRSYGEMVVATVVFSAGMGWLTSSLLPLALSHVAAEHQGTGIGLFGSMEDLGLLVGPLLFGAFWSAVGPASIYPVVVAVAAVGAATAYLFQRGRPAPPAPGAGPLASGTAPAPPGSGRT